MSSSIMLSDLFDYDDVVRFLRSEIEEARKRGILGETGPEVAEENRDKRAEDIDALLLSIVDLVEKIKKRNEVEPEPYLWYSARAIVGTFFGSSPSEHSLQERVNKLAKYAYKITRSTSHFRERYDRIYRAAFYATLPDLMVRREVCIRNDSIKYSGITSVIGVGLRVEQSRRIPYSHLVMDLDTAHLLDKKLVSLSVEVANLLDTVWTSDEHKNADTSDLVYRVGDVFQDLLLASQGNIFVRMSISGYLNDVSNILTLLKTLLSSGSSGGTPYTMKASFLIEAVLAHRRQLEEGHFIQSQAIQALENLRRKIEFLATRDAATANSNTDDLELPEYEEFSNGDTHSIVGTRQGYTFEGITQQLRESCTLEKYDENANQQNTSFAVAVSEGSFAVVYKVKLAEERMHNFRYCPEPGAATKEIRWSFDEVAVKVLHRSVPENTLSLRALREYVVWSQMHHPNIIPLVGLWFNFKNVGELPAFVSPWAEHGTLTSYLSVRRLRRKQRLCLLLDVAKALVYMHNHCPRVCHGDVNPDNILVISGKAFVNDFGISHIAPPNHGLTTNPHGNWRYRAPELLKDSTGSKPTPQSDMYSFGLLCYKVLTDLNPWDSSGITEGMRIINPYIIIPRPNTMGETDYALLRYCWTRDPRLRATANVAVAKLKELIALEILS